MSTATITPIRRSVRVATATRWDAALSRAIGNGVQIRYEASTGMAVATSATDDKLAYVTDGRICTCPAGANGDPVCQHRALYWHERGMLDPEPPTPAAPAVPAACGWCNGLKRFDGGTVAYDCHRCGGTGRVAA